MDKLLDKEVNTQYKAPSLVTYLNSRSSASSSASTAAAMAATAHPHLHPHPNSHHPSTQSSVHTDGSSSSGLVTSSSRAFSTTAVRPHPGAGSHHQHGSDQGLGGGPGAAGRDSEAAADTESSNDVTPTQSLPSSNSGSTSGLLSGGSGNGGARPKTTYSLRYNRWVPLASSIAALSPVPSAEVECVSPFGLLHCCTLTVLVQQVGPFGFFHCCIISCSFS